MGIFDKVKKGVKDVFGGGDKDKSSDTSKDTSLDSGGSYDPSSGTYTAPSGQKQSRRPGTVPEGTKISTKSTKFQQDKQLRKELEAVEQQNKGFQPSGTTITRSTTKPITKREKEIASRDVQLEPYIERRRKGEVKGTPVYKYVHVDPTVEGKQKERRATQKEIEFFKKQTGTALDVIKAPERSFGQKVISRLSATDVGEFVKQKTGTTSDYKKGIRERENLITKQVSGGLQSIGVGEKASKVSGGAVTGFLPTSPKKVGTIVFTGGLGGLTSAGLRTGTRAATKIGGRTGAKLFTGTAIAGGTALTGKAIVGTGKSFQKKLEEGDPVGAGKEIGRTTRDFASFAGGASVERSIVGRFKGGKATKRTISPEKTPKPKRLTGEQKRIKDIISKSEIRSLERGLKERDLLRRFGEASKKYKKIRDSKRLKVIDSETEDFITKAVKDKPGRIQRGRPTPGEIEKIKSLKEYSGRLKVLSPKGSERRFISFEGYKPSKPGKTFQKLTDASEKTPLRDLKVYEPSIFKETPSRTKTSGRRNVLLQKQKEQPKTIDLSKATTQRYRTIPTRQRQIQTQKIKQRSMQTSKSLMKSIQKTKTSPASRLLKTGTTVGLASGVSRGAMLRNLQRGKQAKSTVSVQDIAQASRNMGKGLSGSASATSTRSLTRSVQDQIQRQRSSRALNVSKRIRGSPPGLPRIKLKGKEKKKKNTEDKLKESKVFTPGFTARALGIRKQLSQKELERLSGESIGLRAIPKINKKTKRSKKK